MLFHDQTDAISDRMRPNSAGVGSAVAAEPHEEPANLPIEGTFCSPPWPRTLDHDANIAVAAERLGHASITTTRLHDKRVVQVTLGNA